MRNLRSLAPLLLAFVTGGAFAAEATLKQLAPWKGGKTPPLELRSLDGKTRTLADHRGKVVLLNFWATWCEPCREEMPAIQKLQERYAGRLAVVAVNFGEGEPRIRDFLKRVPVDFEMLLDTEQRSPKAWGVRILPTSFLIGPDGQITQRVVGEYDWSSNEAINAVEALLKK